VAQFCLLLQLKKIIITSTNYNYGKSTLHHRRHPDYWLGRWFFAFHVGGIIHILLVIAVIAIIFKALSRAA
jgi:hypothetical protein